MAKIVWKNIYELPANTVGEPTFEWQALPLNRFHIVKGKRVRMKPEVETEGKSLSEPSMATMANL